MKQQQSRTEAALSNASPHHAPELENTEGERAGKWTVLTIVAIGVFMATLDSSIVNISLPTIAHDFSVPLNGAIEWVIIAYLVVNASTLLTAGRLADMIGRKVVWSIGLIIFTLGSAFCGAAQSLPFLIAMRALQGLGGALLMAVSPAMLTNAFPPNERGRALGLNAVIVALGISVGPTLGGIITASLTWRWIFYVNVPVGIIGLIATLRLLTERLRRNPGRFDPLGAILLAIGLGGLTAALSFGQELGWNSFPILTALIVGLLSLVILPFVELRVPNPIIILSLLKNRIFALSLLSLIINFLATIAVSFILPFYLEQLRHFPMQESGLLLTPLPVTLAVLSPFTGRLSDRIGSRWLTPAGMAIICLGLIAISALNEKSSIWNIIWPLIMVGAGQAIFQPPNNSTLLGSAPRELQGSASGFLATGRTFGQSVSVALAGAVFVASGAAMAGLALVSQMPQQDAQVAELQQVFVNGFHVTFLVCAGIAVVGVFTSLSKGKQGQKS